MNLENTTVDVKSESGVSLPQTLEAPRDPQAWEMVQELRQAASGTSTDFWTWYWSLSKSKRRALLDAVAV